MRYDARLSNPLLLLLAGRRVLHRQSQPLPRPMREVTLVVEYIDPLTGTVEKGPRYTYAVPVAQLTRAWREARRHEA